MSEEYKPLTVSFGDFEGNKEGLMIFLDELKTIIDKIPEPVLFVFCCTLKELK